MEKTAAEWEIEFNNNKVPAARVRKLDETLSDPQLNFRSVLQSVDNESEGEKYPVAAFKFTNQGPALNRPPPVFAQHTQELLFELGYNADQFGELENQGIIHIDR